MANESSLLPVLFAKFELSCQITRRLANKPININRRTDESIVQQLSSKTYQAKPINCKLEIFTDASRVQVKYSEIAIVTHKTQQDAFSDKGASAITSALREEACKLGADGLIMKNVIQGAWGDPGRGEAVAIKFE